MRLITLTAIVCLALATAIGTLTNLTYSFAPTSMCLTLLTQTDTVQIDIHAESGLLLHRQKAILEQRRIVESAQESPDGRFVATMTGTSVSQKLWFFDRQTGQSENLATGMGLSFQWSSDGHILTYKHHFYNPDVNSWLDYLGIVLFSAQGMSFQQSFDFDARNFPRFLPDSDGVFYIEGDQVYVWTLQNRKWANITLPFSGAALYSATISATTSEDRFVLTYPRVMDLRSIVVVLSLTSLTSQQLVLEPALSSIGGYTVMLPSQPQTSFLSITYMAQNGIWYVALVDDQHVKVLNTFAYDQSQPFIAPLWAELGRALYVFAPESDGNTMLLRYDVLANAFTETIIRHVRLFVGMTSGAQGEYVVTSNQQLVAITEHDSRYDLVLLDLSDGSVTTLLKDKRRINPMQWSPNQHATLVVWEGDDSTGVLTLDVQTGHTVNTVLDVKLSTRVDESSINTLWFSNALPERVVLYIRVPSLTVSTRQQLLIRILNLRSGELTPLAGLPDRSDYALFQTADLTTFWVDGVLANQHRMISEYDAAGNLLTTFIGPERGDWDGYLLSPDGKHLLVRYPQSVYLLDAETGSAQKLAVPSPYLMSWSPNGAAFVMSDQQTAAIFSADGKLRHQVRLPSAQRELVWNACH
ncbi:MAG: hypothetical protein KF726_16165 [Anaerolineae bacterium]|nr:hypothetical protein [Anaerolineae bacterium]